jgi:SanA protein
MKLISLQNRYLKPSRFLLQRLKRVIVTLVLVSVSAILLTYHVVRAFSVPYITSDITEVDPVKTGMVLGTSKTLRDGRQNVYFYKRMEAAAALYHAGKIRFIIVSGDNSVKSYNEPLDMKNELMRRGVPAKVIYLDYAGFRTFDSVIRAREIFGQHKLIIISQKFHNERAVFIARREGIIATGFNAGDVSAYYGFKTHVREYLARVKVLMDMISGVQPRFLGDKIEIK